MEPIKFGTDGWRAKIADTYTRANVRRAAFGLAAALHERKKRSRVLVGFDPRFGSEMFASDAAGVLAASEHEVILSRGVLPTPALSLALGKWKADAGVMITASHNSGAYNGFKIKLPPGVSAGVAFTKEVESRLPQADPGATASPSIPAGDFLSHYLSVLRGKVDLRAIRSAGFRLVADPMHGAAGRHLEELLRGGKTKATTIAFERDAWFGGRHPEPIDRFLGPLKAAVRAHKAHLGLATDGDADRIGLVDAKGRFVDVHKVHALLLYHLWKNRAWRGSVVKTVSGTLMIDRMAKAWGVPIRVTPVGFKYIGDVMVREDVLLGVEESGGIAVKGHLPERDGLFSGLLILEALASLGKGVEGAVAALQKEFGPFHSDRTDLEDVPQDLQTKVMASLKNQPPAKVAGFKVTGVETLDGVKLCLEDGWLLVRASGTEPLLRLYAEAPTLAGVRSILKAAEGIVGRHRRA